MSEASVSLDRALLGAVFHEEHRLASIGALVRVRVLSPRELAEAGVSRGDVESRAGAVATAREAAVRSRILAASCSLSGGARAFDSATEVDQMPAGDVAALWACYVRAHGRTYDLGNEIRTAMEERECMPAHWVEKSRAANASGLVAYYGLRSALDATSAQVIWFARLIRKEET